MNLPTFPDSKPIKVSPGVMMLQGGLRGNAGLSVGVDPGVNFGLTIINMEYVQVFYGKLQSDRKDPGYRGIAAYDYIKKSVLKNFMPGINSFPAVVEGAAYNAFHGQVALEEVRFGFFLGLHHLGFQVSIVPPATIRKVVMGDGRSMLPDHYVTMNQNAADSIGVALYGLLKKEKYE